MVVNATFNNISVISWPSILLDEEIGIPSSEITNTPFTSSCILLIKDGVNKHFCIRNQTDRIGYVNCILFYVVLYLCCILLEVFWTI
jgi:hypothetical protein